MTSLRVRNVLLEMTMEERSLVPLPPTSSRVPVFHIFGCLPTGEKACLHVHGVLPYITLRVGGAFSPRVGVAIQKRVDDIVRSQLAREGMETRADRNFVVKIEQATGRSMYGYHEEEEDFVRLFFGSPFYASKAALALADTGVSLLQPFEAHVPLSLQFAIDHSIFGMDFVAVRSARFRIRRDRHEEETLCNGLTVGDVIASDSLLSPLESSSSSHIEADVLRSDIYNADLHANNAYSLNPGLEYLWVDEEGRKGEAGEGRVEDTFSKCCAEKRPSTEFNAEKEYFKRLRRHVRSLREAGLEEGTSGGCTQGLDETANESRAIHEESLIGAWEERTMRERREATPPSSPIGETPQSPLEEKPPASQLDDRFDLASSSLTDSYARNEHDVDFMKDEYDEDDEDTLMEKTFMDIAAGAAQRDAENSQAQDDAQFNSDPASAAIVTDQKPMEEEGPIEKEKEEAREKKKAPIVEVVAVGGERYLPDPATPRQKQEKLKIGFLTLRRKLPFIDPRHKRKKKKEKPAVAVVEEGEKEGEVKEDDASTTTTKKTKTTGKTRIAHPKSYYNGFNAGASIATATVTTKKTAKVEEEGEVAGEMRHLSVVSLEVSTLCTSLAPDPQVDPLTCASLASYSDVCVHSSPSTHVVFIVGEVPPGYEGRWQWTGTELASSRPKVYALPTEEDLIDAIVKFVKRQGNRRVGREDQLGRADSDILLGYEAVRLSWGYVIARATALGKNPLPLLSRYSPRHQIPLPRQYQSIDCRLEAKGPAGRLVLSVWKIARWEVPLRSYDRATAVHEVLKTKVPSFSHSILARLYQDETKRSRLLLCRHLALLSITNVDLLSGLNTFSKTAEMARVYGIQFEEVLTRGSQFRVESMLLRFARRLRLFAPTVTPSQRNKMCAPEQLQLVMEPKSGVYFDPVIVLDFQSLYPSMAIAYNYCYSTCMGKIGHLPSLLDADSNGEIELGALPYRVPVPPLVRMTSAKDIHVSPLGSGFVKWSQREGIVPLMLREILAARIMVKRAAAGVKSKRLARVLDARQLALKLVANVTYGYTAANWSGRMPCVEVADAILGKGRETLERAILMVNSDREKYKGARVIYGDTDSMFVLVPRANLKTAFEIGNQIVDDVTGDNPAPVVLKLEKVYIGCVLQTKKRYAGLSFERESQKEGKFDAKGIETVRRDTCPIVADLLEQSLRLLFARKFHHLHRFLDQKLSTLHLRPYTDFLFCKEFRGEYSPLAHVPQAKIAEFCPLLLLGVNVPCRELAAECPSAFPLVGERVAFIVVEGPLSSTVPPPLPPPVIAH